MEHSKGCLMEYSKIGKQIAKNVKDYLLQLLLFLVFLTMYD